MVKFCPHDLFVNTKADLGPCPKLHCEEAKCQFAEAEDTFLKLQCEDDFVRFAQGMLNDVERKIIKGEQRLALMGKSEPVSFPFNFFSLFKNRRDGGYVEGTFFKIMNLLRRI